MISEPKENSGISELGKRSSAIFGDVESLSGEALFQSIVIRFAGVLPWLAGLVLLGSVARSWQNGWHPFFSVQIAFVLIALVVYSLRQRLPFRWTAVALITALQFVGLLSLISYGLLGLGGAVVLVGVCILCGTIYGQRLGFLAVGLTALLFMVVTVGTMEKWWPTFQGSPDAYMSSVTAWLNAGIVIVVVSVALILCVSAIQEQLRLAATMNRAESIFINSTLNAQQDLFFVFDASTGKALRWNDSFRKFTGLSDEEIEKRRVPDDWLDRVDIPLDDLTKSFDYLNGEQENYLEVELKDQTGEKVPMEFRVAVVNLPDQHQVVTCIGRDLRERRAAERALRESERHFRMISETMPAVVWTVNHAGQLTFMSNNVIEVCGFSAEEIRRSGLNFWVPRIHEDDQAGFKNAFMNLLVHHQPSDYRYRFLTKDNRLIWLNERAVVISEQAGEPAACGVFWDITEQVKTAEYLQQSEKLQALGQLAGGIAHDFNNQISAIMGLSQLLLQEVAKEPRLQSLVKEITNCADHAAALPNQLMTFSRKGSQKSRETDVHEIIRQVVSILGRSVIKRINFITRLEASNPVVVTDPSQLENALLNLCLNAQDAMPKGGDLIIATERRFITAEEHCPVPLKSGEYFCLSVTDTGEGMSEETKKHIFEPFFTTKPPGRGTGMGLSMVFGFVKGLGGDIKVVSQPGQGTTMTLMLPGLPSTTDVLNNSKSSRKKILLVDDEAEVLAVVSAMLQDIGLNVVSCPSGKLAVKECERQDAAFSLAILDMVMPEYDGAETFAELHKLDKDLPVLLISARATDAEVKRVLNQGASDFLPKPFNLGDLKNKIDSMMTEGC